MSIPWNQDYKIRTHEGFIAFFCTHGVGFLALCIRVFTPEYIICLDTLGGTLIDYDFFGLCMVYTTKQGHKN